MKFGKVVGALSVAGSVCEDFLSFGEVPSVAIDCHFYPCVDQCESSKNNQDSQCLQKPLEFNIPPINHGGYRQGKANEECEESLEIPWFVNDAKLGFCIGYFQFLYLFWQIYEGNEWRMLPACGFSIVRTLQSGS